MPVLAGLVLAGCSDQTPAGKTVDARDLNKQRASMLTPEERERMKPPPDHVVAPGAGSQGSGK